MQTRLDPRTPESIRKVIQSSGACTIWAVCSDDPLLQGEAADAIRQHARSCGVTERQLDVPDRSFDWKNWLASCSTGSLFSDKRLIDLRLPTGKPGIEGSKTITAWCAQPPEDTVLLVSLPRADKAMLGATWFASLEKAGTVIIIPELYRSDLAGWISQRLRSQGLSATPDAIAWICDQCEGNLMAAHQEILKLAFHHRQSDKALDVADVRNLVADVARFNPFSLGEAVLGGDVARAVRILRGLAAEAEPVPLVLWAITEDIRMLARVQQLIASGRPAESALREARIPRHRERLLATACRRIPLAAAIKALRQAAEVDTIVKGLKTDDPWVALERMVIELNVHG